MAWDDDKSSGDVIASADWDAMVTDQKTRGIPSTESASGSDCSGSNGAKARVLTLSNTSATKSGGWNVFIDGMHVNPTDVTFTHSGASDTITFTNNNIFDTMKITVTYFE